MGLILKGAITPKEWCEERLNEKIKFQNISYLTEFNKAIVKFKDDFDGEIIYQYKNKTPTHNKILYYAENTPIFYLFKLSPNYFYMDQDDESNLWKRNDVDGSIIEKINSLVTNKYIQQNNKIEESGYILFPLQTEHPSFDSDLFFNCVKWALQNKKKIIFKLHPFHRKDKVNDCVENLNKYSSKIEKYIKVVDTSYNIDDLIDNCDMLWSFRSGSGLQAILKGKPVSYFHKPYDFHPICKYASSPQEAYESVYNEENVKRFLSWYYYKLTLDITAENFEDRLYQRLDNYFNKGYAINDLF